MSAMKLNATARNGAKSSPHTNAEYGRRGASGGGNAVRARTSTIRQ
jgi:hypothetical protein